MRCFYTIHYILLRLAVLALKFQTKYKVPTLFTILPKFHNRSLKQLGETFITIESTDLICNCHSLLMPILIGRLKSVIFGSLSKSAGTTSHQWISFVPFNTNKLRSTLHQDICFLACILTILLLACSSIAIEFFFLI